jgi:hypothetical protein
LGCTYTFLSQLKLQKDLIMENISENQKDRFYQLLNDFISQLAENKKEHFVITEQKYNSGASLEVVCFILVRSVLVTFSCRGDVFL